MKFPIPKELSLETITLKEVLTLVNATGSIGEYKGKNIFYGIGNCISGRSKSCGGCTEERSRQA